MDQTRNQAPVTRKYSKEVNTADLPITQKADIDLDQPIIHGEALANVAGDVDHAADYLARLKFNEDPVTIIINETGKETDYPETHVPVQVQGKGAEVFYDGKWISICWLPIGQEITTKRKYLEALLRSKSETVRTQHDDATVERPRNMLRRSNTANYPVQIMEDRNPLGREWLSGLMRSH